MNRKSCSLVGHDLRTKCLAYRMPLKETFLAFGHCSLGHHHCLRNDFTFIGPSSGLGVLGSCGVAEVATSHCYFKLRVACYYRCLSRLETTQVVDSFGLMLYYLERSHVLAWDTGAAASCWLLIHTSFLTFTNFKLLT